MLCISPFSQVDGGAAPPSGDPASLLSPWEPASAEGKAPVPRARSICQGLPTLPAAPPPPPPTFTRVAQEDGFRVAFCLPTQPRETAPRGLLRVAGI